MQKPVRSHRVQEDTLDLMVFYDVYKGSSGEIPSGLCYAREQVI